MLTAKFWKQTAERAVKTGAQAAVLAIGADQVNAFDVDYADVAGFGLGGVLLSALTSLASYKLGSSRGPSLTE